MSDNAKAAPMGDDEGGPQKKNHGNGSSAEPLIFALRYAKRGWRVIPAPRGMKHPTVKEWQKKATTDINTIIRWWTATPDANVCIATGRGSNLFGVDVDDKAKLPNGWGEGSAALYALEQQHGEEIITYTVSTGSGGSHRYFSYEGIDFALGNSARKLGPGLDIRADGGQLIAPPSWVDDPAHKYPYTPLIDYAVAPAPKWLLDLLRPVERSRDPFTGPGGSSLGVLGWLAKAKAGEQEPALNWALWKMHREGRSAETARTLVWPIMSAWDYSREPWTERDLDYKIQRLWGRS
jgi:hypothetical protein